MSNTDKNEAVGCIVALWQIFITLPLFLAVIIGILVTISPPTWVWVCAVLYIPSVIFGMIVSTIVKLLLD